MTLLTISEAARQLNCSRTKLHKDMKAGKLSKSSFPDGAPAIELSELLRVYGPLQPDPVTPVAGPATPAQPAAGPDYKELLAEERISSLQKQLQMKDEMLQMKDALVAELRQRLLLLSAPRETQLVQPEDTPVHVSETAQHSGVSPLGDVRLHETETGRDAGRYISEQGGDTAVAPPEHRGWWQFWRRQTAQDKSR